MRKFAAMFLAALALAAPAAAQPRAPQMSGVFHGVVSAADNVGTLSFRDALGEARRYDVLQIEGRDDPAVYQSAQTVREILYDLDTPAGRRIAEYCAGPCRIDGTIRWQEPNSWWFETVSSVQRLPGGFDFGLLSLDLSSATASGAPVNALSSETPEHRVLVETLRAAMEVELGQMLRFTPIAVRTQGDFAYVVVLPTGPEGAEVDYEITPWRDQWRYGPWDGGYIHALFHRNDDRWTLENFVISPVTESIVGAWPGLYRIPRALFEVDVRGEG